MEPSAAEKQLKDVASLYEKQFLREMVKQMRATVNESEFMPSGFAEKYYREQLDQQYVEQWGDKGGIGLGKMIYDQLVDRYGDRLGIRVPKEKPMGPLPLSQKDLWMGQVQERNKAIQFDKIQSNEGKPTPIQSPWDAQWLGSFKLENGLEVAKLDHQGVKSLLIGNFQFSDRQIGDKISAGENLGVLAPDAKQFLWKMEEKE